MTDETPCIESARTPSQIYPVIWHDGRRIRESRYVWAQAHGPIPDGLFVCHHCDNPRCVRLDHLFLGTNRDNQRDVVSKGRHRESRKTHCPQGHEYTPENTYRPPSAPTQRHCRTCLRERNKIRNQARSAAARQAVA